MKKWELWVVTLCFPLLFGALTWAVDVTTRSGKGAPLTNAEIDANFTGLQTEARKFSTYSAALVRTTLAQTLTNKRFGGATDYAEFEADGTMALSGAGTSWEDLRIDGLTTRAGATAPVLTAGHGGNAVLYSLRFANSGTEIVYFNVQIPHSYKVNSVIYPHVHFSPVGSETTGTVQFKMDCSRANIGGVFGAYSTTTMTKSWATGNQQWNHLIASYGAGMAGNRSISHVMNCRLYRDNAVAGNYAGAVTFEYMDIHYEVDTPAGSRQEFIK